MYALLFVALCHCVCATDVFAQSTTRQRAADAGDEPTYTADPARYVRLRVTLTYGDLTSPIDMRQCPSGTLWDNRDFEEILNANRTMNLGFEVTLPSGNRVQLTPVQISVKKKWWSDPECNVHIDQIQFISPIYSIYANAAGRFHVAPALFIRERPEANFVALSQRLATEAAKLANAPAPVSETIGRTVYNVLEGAGTNYSGRFGVDLVISPRPGHPEDRIRQEWRAQTELLENEEVILIVAELENVASIVAPTEATLRGDLVVNNNYSAVRDAPVLGEYGTGQARTLDLLVQYASRTTEDYKNFNAALNAGTANIHCVNIRSFLNQAGLSPTDRALALWSMARAQPNIGGGTTALTNLDQISCVRDDEPQLKAVGVQLRPISESQDTEIPRRDQMQTTLEGDDRFARFVRLEHSEARNRVAARVFARQPQYADPRQLLFNKSTPQTLENNDQWTYQLTNPERAILVQVGCYAYFPSSAANEPSYAWAIGQTATGEVALRLDFAAGRPARVARLNVYDTLSENDRRSILEERRANGHGEGCGVQNWRPTLLFGTAPSTRQ